MTNSDEFSAIVEHASRRYRSSGIAAWRFARAKLRVDAIYRAVWEGPWLAGGALLDLGCGQGLMLSVIASARELHGSALGGPNSKGGRAPDRLIGIETRAHIARIAQNAVGREAEILSADARETPFPLSRTILVFDVLHLMPAADQERLLDRLLASLEPGGLLLLREADADAGWKFQVVKVSNSTKAVLGGKSPRHFHFRTAEAWRAALSERGLNVEVRPMHVGTPFGNLLLVARRPMVGTHREQPV